MKRISFSEYWQDAKRPLVSFVFVLPLLITYEVGMLLLGQDAMRNGADVWLRMFLDAIGFGQYFLLPLLTCGTLLAWHHLRAESWQLRGATLLGMLLEVALCAGLLLVLARGALTLLSASGLSFSIGARLALVTGYLGAGIYEELLFRLMLLPATMGVLRMLGAKRFWSIFGAIVIGSLLFSFVHYRFDVTWFGMHLHIDYGDAFQWPSFWIRFVAGILFSMLFWFRGFGIAVGTHALYDILTLVN